MKISIQRVATGFTGEFCYTHARGAVRSDGTAIITTQPLRLSGCDIFSGMEMMKSSDRGKTWSEIRPCRHLRRYPLGNGCEQVFANATPFYHKATGTFFLTGRDNLYRKDEALEPPVPFHTVWSVYRESEGDWAPFHLLEMPTDENESFFDCGSGCGQIFEMDNGELLIPVYFRSRKESASSGAFGYRSAVLRCSFDGKTLRLLECGGALSHPVPRGFYEPSVIRCGTEFLLALRNDISGYVTKSSDGLHYKKPVPLRFDDGTDSGNYNTQQHWIVGGGKPWLVYTRRGADNDHVFRHRAPLFLAEFDPARMCLIRSTERIVVPERGARLGNFGCVHVDENESWGVVSEWMQTTGPDPGDWKRCMSHGSDNSIFISRIQF